MPFEYLCIFDGFAVKAIRLDSILMRLSETSKIKYLILIKIWMLIF